MVVKLLEEEKMKMIWSEISYFSKWWDSIDSQKKDAVKRFVVCFIELSGSITLSEVKTTTKTINKNSFPEFKNGFFNYYRCIGGCKQNVFFLFTIYTVHMYLLWLAVLNFSTGKVCSILHV